MQTSQKPEAAPPEWQAIVAEKVRSMRFGVVQIVVHEGQVTQIESTEKTRLDARPSTSKRR